MYGNDWLVAGSMIGFLLILCPIAWIVESIKR